MQVFINNFFTNADEHVFKIPLISKILLLIYNLTDKLSLLPIFIDIGYAEKTIDWTDTDVFVSHIEDLGKPIFYIVYNLSRDKTGLKRLRTKRAFDMLMKHKERVDKQEDVSIKKTFGTTLVALALNDEQPEENRKSVIETTDILYQSCRGVDPKGELIAEGLHLSEVLELLHRAFTNTYAIKHILDQNMDNDSSPIQYFTELFLSIYGVLLDPEPDQLEKRAVESLLKVLSQISNYPEYLEELAKNTQFCIMIEYFAKRPKQDDAQHIWYNLEASVLPNKEKKTNSSMIYISYDRVDEVFCKDFIKQLRLKIPLPIWVDYENVELDEGMWEHAYSIVQSATTIIRFSVRSLL